MKYMAFRVGKPMRCDRFHASTENDHEHCVMCGGKFSENASVLQTGYRTTDAAHWVCSACFDEYRAEYQWSVLSE